MSNKVTNSDIYDVLLTLKEDVGGLKSSSGLFIEGLKNHSARLTVLEDTVSRQKGAAKVWALIATSAAAIAGGLTGLWHR